jgi:predicted MFS family arabinose efflux permease
VRSALEALRERPFRLLFLGRTASLLGNAFAPVALAFAVLDDLDGSATALGLVLAAAWVPQIVFTLLGGIWADRLPRNLVMVSTDLTMFAAQAAVAALLLTGSAELWMLAATQAVRGTAMAFFYPAAAGLVPQVVSRHRLQQANALLRMSQSATNVLGAATAGILVAVAGAGWAIGFDALTFLASASFLVRIRLPRAARATASNLLRELGEGWSEFRSREWLWVIVAAAAIGNLCGQAGVIVLGPVVADRELGGADAWGFIVAGTGLGLIAGGLISLRIRPARPMLVAQLAILLMAPQFVLLAVAAPVPLIVLSTFVAGIGIEIFGVLWDTALQQHIPHDRLSRVSAWDQLGSFVVIPIGLTIAGPLADSVGVTEAILLFGGLFFLAQGSALLSRDVRTLRRLPVEPATPPSEEFALPTTGPAP